MHSLGWRKSPLLSCRLPMVKDSCETTIHVVRMLLAWLAGTMERNWEGYKGTSLVGMQVSASVIIE